MRIINDKRNDAMKTVGEIGFGDTYLFKSHLYMKVDADFKSVDEDVPEPIDIDKDIENTTKSCSVLDLETGICKHVNPEIKVRCVEATVKILH